MKQLQHVLQNAATKAKKCRCEKKIIILHCSQRDNIQLDSWKRILIVVCATTMNFADKMCNMVLHWGWGRVHVSLQEPAQALPRMPLLCTTDANVKYPRWRNSNPDICNPHPTMSHKFHCHLYFQSMATNGRNKSNHGGFTSRHKRVT